LAAPGHKILTRHRHTQFAPELIVVGGEVSLEFLATLRITGSDHRLGRTVPFDEQIPDRLAAWHAQRRAIEGAAQKLAARSN